MSHILRPDLDPAALNVIMGADAAYLAEAFSAIDDTYGSEEAFLRQALHVTDAERSSLRAALLERPPA
jgi:protein-tyrosine phosphatase